MWPTFVWCLIGIVIVSNPLLAKHKSLTDIHTVLPSTIPDTEYEQVIAERYLFAPFANESTAWVTLSDIHSVWQAVSLPQYHSQAAEGVWLLGQTTTKTQRTEFMNTTLHMFWMSLSASGTLVTLTGIDVNTNISKIAGGIFVEDLGVAGWLFIATDTGLHGLNLSTFTIVPFVNEIHTGVSSLAWSSKRQTVFFGTDTKLWIHSYGTDNEGWRFEHITGLIDAPITSLVYNDVQDQLWVGQDTGITFLLPVDMSTGRLHWYFSRLAGQISNPGSYIGHLPLANITVLGVSHSTVSDSRVWLGSIYGVMRFNPNDSDMNAWRVFNSARYMPNRNALVDVSSLAVLSCSSTALSVAGSAAVAVTSKGLSVLRFEMWTLAQKVRHFQSFLEQPGRHNKYNLVSDCPMSLWGDNRSCTKGSSDNDGLWTTMYLSSQIFRYAVTKDPAVKVSAWTHFEALELLNQVSGIPGYPSRSFAKRSDFPPSHSWYLSPTNSTLQFKGDTSSDEIVGHEFVYPLVHDLLAGNDDERQRAYILVLNITTNILTHDWYLVGEKHTPTTWGFWNPIRINNDSNVQDDRGINSLEILAYLLQTYAYSGDERFLDGAKLLIDTYQYDINLINAKMIAVCENNFSDDQLAYLSYFNLVYAINTITLTDHLSPGQKARAKLITDKLLEYMKTGLDLFHRYTQTEKSPFYNFIYCYASGQVNQTQHLFNKNYPSSVSFNCSSLSTDGIWHMQRWPLELINWPQFNTVRLDVQRNKPAECNGKPYALHLLPPDERNVGKWNSNAYSLDYGTGFKEEDPTPFLISYWGMRYFNLLGE
ncbi:unnamed protein product [Adineta steineri]|uniref:Uncharacterized protein n=1 Tax=Adineta steineri TaxID=433720 RepID=A0A818QYV5_9BILA|nr:unnamed protein product [Adineta steineri]